VAGLIPARASTNSAEGPAVTLAGLLPGSDFAHQAEAALAAPVPHECLFKLVAV